MVGAGNWIQDLACTLRAARIVYLILQEPSKKSKATTEELAREVDVRGWERACYTTQNYRVSGNSQGFTYNGRHI